MAQLNKTPVPTGPDTLTHEGAPAYTPRKQANLLKRLVNCCMLWEDTFYVDGKSIAQAIKEAVHAATPEEVSAIAIYARSQGKLRHAPLYLARELARHPNLKHAPTGIVSETIFQVIQRADELAEFLAIYWAETVKGRSKHNKGLGEPLSNQVKKGLRKAFLKFDAYQISKYNRDKAITLRDVLFLVHPEPTNEAQAALFKSLAADTLTPPNTWEVRLSGGEDKKAVFEDLLRTNKLGYMALLRNLRNMTEAKVDPKLVKAKILESAGKSRVLPFRFIAAAKHAVQFERELDQAMIASMAEMPKLNGLWRVLVDVSGSMDAPLSGKSELQRIDAACALAALVAGVTENCEVFAFSDNTARIPPRQGMALIDAIKNSMNHSGTYLGKAVTEVTATPYNGLIVITDEQSHDRVTTRLNPATSNYMINVGTDKPTVAFGDWTSLTGFSESIVDFIRELQNEEAD